MSRPIGSKTVYFSKVKEAREALAAKSLELFELYQDIIKKAAETENFEVAAKGVEFLLSHMPKDEDGGTLLEPSVDTKKEAAKGNTGPTIQIGIALGGVGEKKALPPAQIIDVEVEPSE